MAGAGVSISSKKKKDGVKALEVVRYFHRKGGPRCGELLARSVWDGAC